MCNIVCHYVRLEIGFFFLTYHTCLSFFFIVPFPMTSLFLLGSEDLVVLDFGILKANIKPKLFQY